MQKCKREEEKISFQNLDAEETLLTCSSCLELCSRGQSRSSPGFVGERAEVSQSSTSAPAENACPLPHTEENFQWEHQAPAKLFKRFNSIDTCNFFWLCLSSLFRYSFLLTPFFRVLFSSLYFLLYSTSVFPVFPHLYFLLYSTSSSWLSFFCSSDIVSRNSGGIRFIL